MWDHILGTQHIGQIYDPTALTFEQTIADLHINEVGTAGGSTIDTFSHKTL